MRIFWIDDDTDIIDPVVQPLVADGHEISRIRNVHEALKSLDQIRDCDLILVDAILPSGDDQEYGDYPGVSLLRSLREQHGISALVIVFSVVDSAKVEKQLRSLNVAAYVRKPALPSELKEAVDAAWGKSTLVAPPDA